MHLMEIIKLRGVPAAGLFLSLTRRCPLSCAHCSTNSMLTSEEYAEDVFLRFVATFTPTSRPEILMLTGGEALLRPRLVQALVEQAHAVGTRVFLISGMFFARQETIPPAILRAIAPVDHFSASLDIFHEREVSRAAVLRTLRRLYDQGKDISLHVVGLDAEDPYLVEVTGDIQRTFDNQVPVWVNAVHPVGRAKQWLKEPEHTPTRLVDFAPDPCASAGWPVVAYDGTVVACCNQAVVDGPVPAHLRLGHTTVDSWATIRERMRESPLLRAIRVFGPQHIAQQHGAGRIACDGYCETCYRLAGHPAVAERLAPIMSRPTMRFVEAQVATLQGERAQYGVAEYKHLVTLGYTPERSVACVD